MKARIIEGPHETTLGVAHAYVYPNKPDAAYLWLNLELSAPSFGRSRLKYRVSDPIGGAVSSFLLYHYTKPGKRVHITVEDGGALAAKAKGLTQPPPQPFVLPLSIAVAAGPDERLEFTASWTKDDGWRITHQPMRESRDAYNVMAANALNQKVRKLAAEDARWFVAFSDAWDAARTAQYIGNAQMDYGVEVWLEELRKARVLGPNKCRDLCVNSLERQL